MWRAPGKISLASLDFVHLDLPIFLLHNVGLQDVIAVLDLVAVVAADRELAKTFANEESKHTVLDCVLIHHRQEGRSLARATHLLVGQTKDAIKDRTTKEGARGQTLGKADRLLAGELAKGDDVLRNHTGDFTGSVLDVKGRLGVLVGLRVDTVKALVRDATVLDALGGRDPEITRTGVKDNVKGLLGVADPDLTVVAIA